ncbi:MAG: glycosyltransferase family 4 protein [Chloroflexi bacterium]|nr:glycosyltransferase family 4 protein [Chloroflexota bacterium]
MNSEYKPTIHQIAFIGNYLPRQCGIATFTSGLAETIALESVGATCFALAVNDIDEGYDYPSRVRFELTENDIESYRRAADFLNMSSADVVSLQHEFGIYGGTAGAHILALLKAVRMPVVTTFHTILREPDKHQYKVMKEIADRSNRVISMSWRGVEYLRDVYHIPPEKIDYIPHGIPDVPFVDPNFFKDKFKVEGKIVLLTFGLLSRNKGIEYVLKAIPEIVEQFPNLVYIVLGATHPNVLRQEGESYRKHLQRLTSRLGIDDHVIFENRFVSNEELVEYIGAADIYITPYLNLQQITSGTLAYTVGAGKAVISTPYWHAEELLSDQRGVLVPFRNSQAIAKEVIYLLENEAERHLMRKKAYLHGRDMIWPQVALQYLESFERARSEPAMQNRAFVASPKYDPPGPDLPSLNLYQLSRLTDSTGILQHAIYSLPNYNEGYTTDDNARALIAAVMLEQLGEEWYASAEDYGFRYLAFLWHAFNQKAGRFHNMFSYDRRWLEEVGSEDSHGRAIWALGAVVGRSNQEALRPVAGMLFNWALPVVMNLTSPRAWAFSLLGIDEYLKRFEGDRETNTISRELAQRLMDQYISLNSSDWKWFENHVTYCNAVLPHALLRAGQWLNSNEMIEAGIETLNWLVSIQLSEDGHFAPVGSNGFYTRGGEKARFDQQPVEAHGMVSACLEAYRLTADETWLGQANRAFDWFLGANELGISLYDPETGGCRDGLHPDRVNQNQGAESTLSFYLSLLELRLFEKAMRSAVAQDPSFTVMGSKARVDTE